MPEPKTNISVLISDDHGMILDALELVLQNSKYKIVGRANTVLSHKENLHHHRPDILILDFNINKHNILDDLESIKALSTNTKIIILSSYDAPFLVKEAFIKGADAFLLLPRARKKVEKRDLWKKLNGHYLGDWDF